MSLPRQQARNASILTLLAERLKQAANLATALPADWREGAALPLGAQQVIARELTVLVRGARSPPGMKKAPPLDGALRRRQA
jgi:hypothetical protein